MKCGFGEIVLEIPCSFSLLNVRGSLQEPLGGVKPASCCTRGCFWVVLVKPCGIEVLMGEEAPVTWAVFSRQEGELF